MTTKTILLIAGGVVVIGGFGGASFYYYSRYQHAQELLRNPTAAVQEEAATLVGRVGAHFVLPQGETPTIATVSDKDKLANQPFFVKAEVGDKVLIYPLAARAILYRPAIDKIIEIGSPAQPSVAGSATTSAQLQEAKLAIYNSTDTAGLASVAQQKVNSEMPGLLTVAKKNSKVSFEKSLVVILSPGAKNLGTQLAGLFSAEVATEMPKDEVRPEADLVLIVGQDYKP
jgi:hypothetical protein